MKISKLLLAFAVTSSLLPAVCKGQEKDIEYEITQYEAGDTSVKMKFDELQGERAQEAAALAAAMQFREANDENSTTNKIINGLNLEFLQNIPDFELLPEQKRQISTLERHFKSAYSGADSLQKQMEVKIAFADRLKEVLLPEQIEAVEETRMGRGGIFSYLRRPMISKFISLKDSQAKEIEERCDELHEEIHKAILDHQAFLETKRQEVLEIADVLNESQKKKIEDLLKH